MWHGVFGLVSPSISGERSFICSKSIKNGSSGLYFWTPRSLKTKALSRFRTSATTNLVTQHHLSPSDTASPFTWWHSITFHLVTQHHLSPGDTASPFTWWHSITFHLVTQHHISLGDAASHFTRWRCFTFHLVMWHHIAEDLKTSTTVHYSCIPQNLWWHYKLTQHEIPCTQLPSHMPIYNYSSCNVTRMHNIHFMLCSNVTAHFRWIWPDKFCILYNTVLHITL